MVVLHAGEHGRGQQVEHHRDRQRQDDRLGQVALGVLGLLGGGAHRVVPEDREEDRRRPGRGAAEAVGEVRREVVGLDVEEPDDDHRQHDRDLDEDQPGLDLRAGLDAAVEQPGDEEAQQDREQVDVVPAAGARRAEHPGRQVDAEAVEQEGDVLRDADRHDGDDRGVLQQQVPADEPAHGLTQDRVAVGVRRPRARDQPAELGVRQRRARARDPGDEERHRDRRPGVRLRHRPGQREDAGADDRAEPDRGQLPQPDAALQAALAAVVLDRLAPEDPARRCHPLAGAPCLVGHESLLAPRPIGARRLLPARNRRQPPVRRFVATTTWPGPAWTGCRSEPEPAWARAAGRW